MKFIGLLITLTFVFFVVVTAQDFELAIIHVNDFHAKFDETDTASNVCKEGQQCIGGYARLITVIKDLQEKHRGTNTLYLNAGDSFSGSLWYSMYRWNVTSTLLNLLPADCMVSFRE